MPAYDFSDAALDALRAEVQKDLSDYRFRHIAEVESMIVRLGALYLPDEIPMLRAAALLHDFTKEDSDEVHEKILLQHGILIREECPSPKLYHAVTAALLIPERFPTLASETLVSAVRYHTTGRAGMETAEMLLYLADFIEDSRTFGDCVSVRQAFWDADPASMNETDRLSHLYKILIETVDKTVISLIRRASPISPDSIRMRNDLIVRLRKL